MQHRVISTALVVTLAALVLASCGSQATSLATPLASAPGVTASSVLFATEVNAEGVSHQNAVDEVAGIRAVLRLFNQHHGVYGRQLGLVVKDDAGQPSIAADETNYLSATVGAFALIGDAPSSIANSVSTEASSSGILQLFPTGQATGPNTANTVSPLTATATELGPLLASLDLANGTIAVVSSTTVPGIATDLGFKTSPEQLSYGTTGKLQGTAQLAKRVPDLVISFAPASVTTRLLATLAALNEAPTVIAAESSTSRAQLRAAVPTFHGTVMRLGPWVPRSALSAAWNGYLEAVDRLLAPKVALDPATLDGIYAATMSIELLRSAGINPSRRAILTSLARHRFDPIIPAFGSWSAATGFQGAVLTGTTRPVYVDGTRVTTTPPRLAAPPNL
ncbi:ABC transporter substrate-binding protein [Ferrimicrobium acidiphilum]|uniref:ABC transporter substrate-binding protein n=1 Tax=Ferrimicrobium acidiphilum TaxID=121039 RepID=UPI0023F17F3D|nr:ABC transporter substrate-binding protein [Ferrimicrobium acidiphilum]